MRTKVWNYPARGVCRVSSSRERGVCCRCCGGLRVPPWPPASTPWRSPRSRQWRGAWPHRLLRRRRRTLGQLGANWKSQGPHDSCWKERTKQINIRTGGFLKVFQVFFYCKLKQISNLNPIIRPYLCNFKAIFAKFCLSNLRISSLNKRSRISIGNKQTYINLASFCLTFCRNPCVVRKKIKRSKIVKK